MKYLLHILLGLNLLATTLVYVQTDQRMGDVQWSIEKMKAVELAMIDLKIDYIEESTDDIKDKLGIY